MLYKIKVNFNIKCSKKFVVTDKEAEQIRNNRMSKKLKKELEELTKYVNIAKPWICAEDGTPIEDINVSADDLHGKVSLGEITVEGKVNKASLVHTENARKEYWAMIDEEIDQKVKDAFNGIKLRCRKCCSENIKINGQFGGYGSSKEVKIECRNCHHVDEIPLESYQLSRFMWANGYDWREWDVNKFEGLLGEKI